MAYRDQYDYGDDNDYEERRRRDYPEDEGFFDRVRGWFRERISDRDRNRDYDRGNQDYGRARREYGNYRDQQPRSFRSGSNRDNEREYGYRRGSPEWERTRQWRRDYSSDQENQGGYVDRYGESQRRYGESQRRYAESQRGYNQNQRRYGSGWAEDEDNEYGLGRNPNNEEDERYGQHYGRDYDRGYGREYGWDQTRDETGDYHRDFRSNQDRDYGNRGRRQTGYSRDYGRDYGEYSNPGYGRGGAYPSAGMGADFSGRGGYEDRDNDEDVNYGEGDVGYESEGAFYQDMDEPINYETQDYQYGSGRFRGMGPQDYQRSDERITEDVCERLTRHGRVDASNIEIDVKNGEVFLKGTVPDRDMKRLAEDVAEDITGVKDVHNEIKVEHSNQQRVRSWETRQDRQRDQDWGNQQQSSWENQPGQSGSQRQDVGTNQTEEREQHWQTPADYSPAGLSNIGAGFESEGATSMEGLESVEQHTPNPQGVEDEYEAVTQVSKGHRGVTTGMEVIGSGGKVVGRVKEVRDNDFLVDRELTRDIYVPYSAIASVGEQILLNVSAHEVDNQGWEKPAIL